MMPISIIQGDITQFPAEAIVNAANCLLLGGGGVDGAIHRAAGPELLAECKTLGGCETGQAKLTLGYRLPAKYVVHTPGPIWRGGGHGEAELLASCYRNCLLLADEKGCKSIAFPSISTGVYHFPIKKAASIALETLQKTLPLCRNVKDVTMVCFSSQDQAVYAAALDECGKNSVEAVKCTFQVI